MYPASILTLPSIFDHGWCSEKPNGVQTVPLALKSSGAWDWVGLGWAQGTQKGQASGELGSFTFVALSLAASKATASHAHVRA